LSYGRSSALRGVRRMSSVPPHPLRIAVAARITASRITTTIVGAA